MKKMIVIGMVFILIIVISTIVYTNNYNKNNKTTNILQNAESISNNNTINTTENNNVESEGKMNNTIKVSIDGKKYNAIVEQNETTKQFMDMLPKEYNMNELNGNEKYTYLDTTLATNTYSPKHIDAGDIMLYGNNCLVVFYKSFDTPYSYTKIGHIENFEGLDDNNIKIKFEK